MEEPLFTPLEETPFDEVLSALLNKDEVLDPLYLYRLSDLNPENLAELIKIWGDIHLERRRALIEDLEHLSESNSLLSFEGVLRLALKDEDPQVRFYATRAIEIYDTDDLIPHFLAVLDEEESLDVRAVTASILGKYIYRGELDKISAKLKKKIENKLLKILNSEEPDDIRRRALEAISYSSRDEVRGQILKAYATDLEEWVASALFAMGRSLDEEYGDLVCDHLVHKSPKVRLEAVRACGELGLENALPVLLDLLDDLPDIRAATIYSLSQIGGEDAGPALQGLLDQDLNDDEVDLIQQALERLDLLEDGLDLAMFNLDFEDGDEIILDDYDYQQDGYDDDFDFDNDDDYDYDDDDDDDDDYDDDDIGLDNFDLDDDYWME
jgi:HEAT repeat protein